MQSPEDLEYLVNIMVLVRSRNKRVVLEGIGTEQQYELLKRLNADGLQGFHFSKPLFSHELDSILAEKLLLPLTGIHAPGLLAP
jgi:EAL domain-containing protein (putative c-di-GMP-specific phosphodiesterase class I)